MRRTMRVISVTPGGPADRAGVRHGDECIALNDSPARDEIDLMYHAADGGDDVYRFRGNDGIETAVSVAAEGDPGVGFEPMRLRLCGNRCVFCFVDQNPPGMREPLYLRDEDYRYSFLYGAYVTLTAVGEDDLARIVGQRLSPLYVSVHAVDPDMRRRLLGLSRDDRLLEKIDRLVAGGIELHCQVVVCPGINDGVVLEQTIEALHDRAPGVGSAAVVPVGLTRHREGLPALEPVSRDGARTIIALTDRLRERYRAEGGSGFVYCADELYLRAERSAPPASYYDDFAQYTNGVGMLREFLDGLGRLRRRKRSPVPEGRYVLVTGHSMASFLERYARALERFPGVSVRIVTVDNRFYGDSVTVAGLLTGADIAEAVGRAEQGETIVLPPCSLNADGRFLDDMTVDGLSRWTGAVVLLGTYDPGGGFTAPDTPE